MRANVLFFTLAAISCSASPVVIQQAASALYSYGYAVDLSVAVPSLSWTCLQQSGYTVAFIRGYAPTGQGKLDPYASTNIQGANAAGLGGEVYMTPVPTSFKTGANQFDEMYGGLKNANINVRSVWIQVTSPDNWYANPVNNIDFLNSTLSRANKYGLSVGIYTNSYDWYRITGEAAVTNSMLWYWNVHGDGSTNESQANYNDFSAFGGWTMPMAKQFAQVESVCGVTVNRDVYTLSPANETLAKHENSAQIVIGSLGLRDPSSGFARIVKK